jgi:hypothetical protein
MREQLRIGGSSNDAAQNDAMLRRIAAIRELMVGMHHVEPTLPDSVAVRNEEGSLHINAIRETKSSRIVCFSKATRNGVRRDVRLSLSTKPRDGIREETALDPYAPIRLLDTFEAIGRRREIFVETYEIGYHEIDEAGASLADAAADVGRTAMALIRSMNGSPYEHRKVALTAPCLGRQGRIVDHRSRNQFAKPLLDHLLAGMPDVVKVDCSNGSHYEAAAVSWEWRLAAMSTDEIMRQVSCVPSHLGELILAGATAED